LFRACRYTLLVTGLGTETGFLVVKFIETVDGIGIKRTAWIVIEGCNRTAGNSGGCKRTAGNSGDVKGLQ